MRVIHILSNGESVESVSGKKIKVPPSILTNENSRPTRSRKNLCKNSQNRKGGTR